jgi:transcriptional regulator with XRE-family HTH domain
MDDQRVGAAFRSIRMRRRLRQSDLAIQARVSTATISRLERGHADTLSVRTIRSVAKALDVRVELLPRWRAGDLDRLLNANHSGLHELVARHFDQLPDWVIQPEVSFAVYGERGIIDILAWHPKRRALLVIELKTDIVDVNELIGTVDRKGRHAIRVAIERGWVRPRDPPPSVSIWIIVADGPTNRRRMSAHRTMLRNAFPGDGRSMPGWLRSPKGPVRALSFWRNDQRGTVTAKRRVRTRRPGAPSWDSRGARPISGAGTSARPPPH